MLGSVCVLVWFAASVRDVSGVCSVLCPTEDAAEGLSHGKAAEQPVVPVSTTLRVSVPVPLVPVVAVALLQRGRKAVGMGDMLRVTGGAAPAAAAAAAAVGAGHGGK